MIRMIKSHNELNGLKFVIFEFGLMALLLIAFAVYCLMRQRLLLGLFFGGIGLNCLPVVYYGLRALRKGEGSSGTIWNPQAREKLIARNPHMLRDTLTLAGATLLPMLVLIFVVVETLHPGETE